MTEQVNKFQKEKEKYVEQNNLLTDVPNDDQTGIDHDMITAVESGEKFNFQSRSFFYPQINKFYIIPLRYARVYQFQARIICSAVRTRRCCDLTDWV